MYLQAINSVITEQYTAAQYIPKITAKFLG